MPHQGRKEASMARINKATVTDYYVIEDMEPKEVLRAVERKAIEGGASFYHPTLTMHRNKTYGCYEEAWGAVDCIAATCYGDQAVMFHDVDSLAPSTEVQDLRERLRMAMAERRAFVRGCRHGIVHSGEPAACERCGAEAAWEDVIDGDYRCPACGNDLLPASVRGRISAYDAQVSSLRRDLHKKEAEQVRLAPVKWLVRCSYHL